MVRVYEAVLVAVLVGQCYRPGIAPNANTTHVPTEGSSAAPTLGSDAVRVCEQ